MIHHGGHGEHGEKIKAKKIILKNNFYLFLLRVLCVLRGENSLFTGKS
jgi:hypothetical protein